MVRFSKNLVVLLCVLGFVGLVAMILLSLRTPSVDVATLFPDEPTTTAPRSSDTSLLTESDTHLVVSEHFSVQLPDGWELSDVGSAGKRNNEGELWYGVVDSDVSENAYSDADVVRVVLKDVLKNGRGFDEVVQGLSWDAGDVKDIVAFMRENTSEVFPDFSEKDVRVSLSQDTVGSAVATVATRQCLKPCYIEGGAQTTVRYLIDAVDRVYVLEITAETSTKTADQLNAATAVVKTFRLIPSSI
jgi:hypothetical protein